MWSIFYRPKFVAFCMHANKFFTAFSITSSACGVDWVLESDYANNINIVSRAKHHVYAQKIGEKNNIIQIRSIIFWRAMYIYKHILFYREQWNKHLIEVLYGNAENERKRIWQWKRGRGRVREIAGERQRDSGLNHQF